MLPAKRTVRTIMIGRGPYFTFTSSVCRRVWLHHLTRHKAPAPKGGPRSIPTLYYGNGSTRPISVRASPHRTPRHVILLAPVRALGALWPRLFSFTVFADGCRRPSRRSSVRGRSLRGAVLCRRGALYPPAAGAAEGSPRLVHRLARL
jgi:hypothetical protein